jgi:hypothetical protein
MSRSRVFWLVFLGLLMIASTNLRAETTCYKMVGSAWAVATSENVYEGEADISFEGQLVTASLTLTILESKSAGNGSIIQTNEIVLDFSGGNTITLASHSVNTPTNDPYVFGLFTQDTVAEGTGLYEGSYGRDVGQGYQSARDMQWFVIVRGRYCLQ